jgi:hypothetical protein
VHRTVQESPFAQQQIDPHEKFPERLRVSEAGGRWSRRGDHSAVCVAHGAYLRQLGLKCCLIKPESRWLYLALHWLHLHLLGLAFFSSDALPCLPNPD